jgi:copper chaperone CopZ
MAVVCEQAFCYPIAVVQAHFCEESIMNETCYVEPIQKEVGPEDQREAQMTILSVWGMGCSNCAARVRNGLLGLDGVVSADIDLERGLAYIDYAPSKTNLYALILAVAAAGNDGRHNYRASVISWRGD